MKKHTRETMLEGLVVHPYETNPDYFARINFFHFSPDGNLATYFWEAPVGEVQLKFERFDEMIFVLAGKLEVTKSGHRSIFRAGDALEISREDGALLFRVLQEVQAVGYVYPLDEVEKNNIEALMNNLQG